MKTSKDFIPLVESLSKTQSIVSAETILNSLAASFAYWNARLANIKCAYAQWFKEHNKPDEKGKYPSVARLEKEWKGTEQGLAMIKLKAEVENLKVLSKAVESHLYTMRAEIKLTQ